MGHLDARNKCPGSGEAAPPEAFMYTTCPRCGRSGIKVNATGVLREHSKVGNHKMTG